MKDLFVAILDWFNDFTEITEANLYHSQTFSSIGFEYEGEKYVLSITKEKKDGNGND